MMFKLSTKCITLFIITTLLFPGVSLAFNSDTRCQMLKDAISICPENLKVYLVNNFDKVHSGIHFADRHKTSNVSIDPYEILSLYHSLQNSIKNNNLNTYNTPHQFGVIACFIAETIAPDSYKYFLPRKTVYAGFQEVTDVNENISMLIESYREPYRHSSAKHEKDFLYNTAVNQIVNYWITIWKAGGKETGILRPQGTVIAHQVFEGHISSRRKG